LSDIVQLGVAVGADYSEGRV